MRRGLIENMMEKLDLHRQALVVENTPICSDHYHLILRDDRVARVTKPGQFVNLRINRRDDLLLRRPFSVAMTRPEHSLFEIVYRVVGKGTSAMVDLRPGDVVDILGPLGVGFHLPERAMNCLLLGGGCGVAPLWGLANGLYQSKNSITALLGFQSSDKVFGEDVFRKCHGEIIVTTDDGSYGLEGLVSDHLEAIMKREIDRVYVCGPTPMLKVVLPMIKRANLKGEVALEEKMGCGYGVCLSCVVSVIREGIIEKLKVCTEGPVFPLEEIVFDHGT